MMLALAEMRRARGRFISIVAALSLITFLVLTLSALSDGLFYGSTGAYRTANANAYAFSNDATGSLIRSRVPVSDIDKYQSDPGVDAISGVGVLLTSGSTDNSEIDVAVFGTELNGVGSPTELSSGRLPKPGENDKAALDSRAKLPIGTVLTVGEQSVTVVGITEDSSYQLQPTLWTTLDTWRKMQADTRPETRGLPPAVSAVALQLSNPDGVASLAQVTGTTALSTEEASLAIPGVKEQRSTLNSIIYTTLLVAAIVVALFFALVVLEKRELFASLKAIGTSTSKLGVTVVIQALIASVFGVIIGAVASRLLGLVVPEQVPTLFQMNSLIQIAIFTIIASVLGAVFSLRRIAKIDPATALGGSLQ